MSESDFFHRFERAADVAADSPTLLLLHGTGGNEDSLIEMAKQFGEQWNLLSPRGKVLEHGMPRYFRRLAEGVFDQEDLKFRTSELADFVEQSAVNYGFDASRVVALGYSNGANIAASLLLSGFTTLRHAILMHPMVPFFPRQFPDLSNKRILITAGENDPVVARSNTLDLESLLTQSGARVEMFWHNSGHNLTSQEIDKAIPFANLLKKSL